MKNTPHTWTWVDEGGSSALRKDSIQCFSNSSTWDACWKISEVPFPKILSPSPGWSFNHHTSNFTGWGIPVYSTSQNLSFSCNLSISKYTASFRGSGSFLKINVSCLKVSSDTRGNSSSLRHYTTLSLPSIFLPWILLPLPSHLFLLFLSLVHEANSWTSLKFKVPGL